MEPSVSASTIPHPEERPWLTVPEAGLLGFGIGRTAAYAAVARGEIPSVRVGGRVVVPTAALRRLLQLDEASAPVSA